MQLHCKIVFAEIILVMTQTLEGMFLALNIPVYGLKICGSALYCPLLYTKLK